MKIQAPIFINAFAGSGSNLVWNLLQSHPRLCSPIWETHELFQRGPGGRLRGALLALLSGQPRFFCRRHLRPRRPLPRAAAAYLDACLHRAKMRTLAHPENRLVAPGTPYRAAEVRRARLVTKNLDGLVLASEALGRAFPGATFIGLLRHGLALLDSQRRRGLAPSARRFGRTYSLVTRRMAAQARTLPRYHLFRFEELLQDPAGFAARLFCAVGLDPPPGGLLRLKAKPHFDARGRRRSPHPPGRKLWLGPRELDAFIQPRVDAVQARRVTPAQRRDFLGEAGPQMAALAYPTKDAP